MTPASPTSLAVIGLGNMGAPMTHALIDAFPGARVLITARNRRKASALEALGAEWTDARGAADAEIVLVMLPDLPEIEDVLFDAGLVAAIRDPTTIVICSTCSPDGVRGLAERVRDVSGGLAVVVDAPVSGGTDGARARTLAVMVGGADADVEHAMPALRAIGRPVRLGPIGSGQVAKACNQAIVAATVLALGEAAALADRSGLDVAALFAMFGDGYANSRILATRGPRMVAEDYRVSGPARYMVKDLGFALDEAAACGIVLHQAEATRQAFADLTARGLGDFDIAVTRAYTEQSVVGE